MESTMVTTLTDFLEHGPAHVPLKKALTGINPVIRNKKMGPQVASIWAELEHMRIAQEDILQYMKTPGWRSPAWPEGYWPDSRIELNEQIWQATLKGFEQDLQETIRLVHDMDENLLDPLPHAAQHTYLREILLIIDHNAYHIGKIIDIRKILGDW